MKRAFPGSGPEIDARYERAGKWLLATIYGNAEARTWCDKKGVAIRKAQGEGIGSGGGFLVPTELENAILDLRDSFGAFRRRACVWPMGSDSSLFPRRTGTAAAFFLSEGGSAATGAATSTNMDGVQLTAKKLAALVTLSSELDEDSIVDLVDYVANEMAWALAAKEDDCAFNGDGSSTYGGMRGIGPLATDGSHGTANVAASNDAFASLTGADLGKLVGAVRASALPRAAWFVSVTGFGQTMVRLASAGGGGLHEGEADGIPTPMYLGFPVVMSQKLPLGSSVTSGKAMMAFGDMYAAAVLGQRRGLTIARSDHRYLDTDQIAILATERFDAVIHDMGDSTNAGSLAVLVAP
jgi:HK97 family phage major capsid protein